MGNNNLEEKNVSMPEKIGGVIFGIWFVASIIAGFVASEIGTDAVMLVVGCIGADMGGVCCERWLFCG